MFKSSKWGRLRDPLERYPRDPMISQSKGVRGTPVKHVFSNLTQKHIKLILTGYSTLRSKWY